MVENPKTPGTHEPSAGELMAEVLAKTDEEILAEVVQEFGSIEAFEARMDEMFTRAQTQVAFSKRDQIFLRARVILGGKT